MKLGALIPSKHSSWWIRLEDVLKTPCVFIFRTHLQDAFKTSSSSQICSPYSYVFRRHLQDVSIKTNMFVLAIHLQDVFKTHSRPLANTSSRRFQEVFKTSGKNVIKTSSRRLQVVLKTSSTRLQDIFKISCKDVFKTVARRIIRLNCMPRSLFWEMYGQCRKFTNAIKIS